MRELIAVCQDCRHRSENSAGGKGKQNFEVANESWSLFGILMRQTPITRE